MADRDRNAGIHEGTLRSDATGPEHGDFVAGNGDLIAEVGSCEIGDPQFCRIACMNRGSVELREHSSDVRSAACLARSERTHRHDERTVKRTGTAALVFRPVHRDIRTRFDVTDGQAGVQESRIEGKRTADKKRNEVIPPTLDYIRRFGDEATVLPDSIPRKIRTNVGSGSELLDFETSRIGDRQDRAGTRIALAKEQKAERVLPGQNDQICLREAMRRCRGGTLELAAAAGVPDVPPCGMQQFRHLSLRPIRSICVPQWLDRSELGLSLW